MTEAERQIEAWRSVAAGWERQRALVWECTHVVAERLVELLAPRPGETVLELAAGPGDTGFFAAASLRPGGRLVSTDGAAEMVEVARRRAAELGLADDVSFAVEDMTALSFDTASFDGVLCRWGLMLVPDMAAAAREIARVTRPGGRTAVAVWTSPDDNEWMTAPGRSALELGLVERPAADAPGPFRLSGDGQLAALLEGAGLVVETVEDVELTWRASSLAAWWDVARDTSRTLALILEEITADEAESVRRGAERRMERYVQPDGSLAVPGRTRVALARQPRSRAEPRYRSSVPAEHPRAARWPRSSFPAEHRAGFVFVDVCAGTQKSPGPHPGSTWRPNRQAGVGGWAWDFPAASNFFVPLFTCRSYTGNASTNANWSEFCNRHIDAEICLDQLWVR